VELLLELLLQKAPMLAEYVALEVAPEGLLTALPAPLEGLAPDVAVLPELLLALGRDVDWGSEKGCFKGLCQVGAARRMAGWLTGWVAGGAYTALAWRGVAAIYRA
jgi:hypothetical protein